jgi:glycerophosphoryl diester phosphodiesterase
MRPLWISHRGYKAAAVENTHEAFTAAVAAGFTALETDLRLSSDGHIVLHHDPDLRRLTDSARRVADLTRRELEAVRLAHDGTEARLLFLEDFLEAFPGCSWVFDVKAETGDGVVRALDALARRKGLHDWIMAHTRFVFWRRAQEMLLRDLFPKAHFYARERECWRAGLSVIARAPQLGGITQGRCYALPARLGPAALYRAETVRAYQSRGASVVAFLPETEADTRAALASGADEILTNGLILKGP